MNREQFLKNLRHFSQKTGTKREIDRKVGKGSHYRVRYGDLTTTVKSGEMNPGYLRLVKKHLGIE